MYLNRITENCELTVKQLSSFDSHNFSPLSASEFVLTDINDTAERIAYSEEKKELSDMYFTEVNIKGTFKCDDSVVTVTGTLGGVLKQNDGFAVDFVKSVKFPLKYVSSKHWEEWLGPTKCSAYLLCKARSLNSVTVRLICVHPESLEKRYVSLTYNKEELEVYFLSLLSEWSKWNKLYCECEKQKREALSRLVFPYPSVRDGQETIIKEVSGAIDDGRPLFVNAPTGIGKTAAVLFPALKAVGEGKGDRVFYLTSKNSLHNVVINACQHMEKNGSLVRVLSLVSRNKLCPSGKCNKKACQRLSGHSQRLKTALYKLVSEENYITPELLEAYSKEFNVCPFELARHYSQFSDVIICDYNYIFDPSVARYDLFSSKGRDILLVDEAHNLVERVREMHSAVLLVDKIRDVAEYLKDKKNDFYKKCLRFLKAIDELISDDLYQAEPLDRNSVDSIMIETNLVFDAFQGLMNEDDFSDCFADGGIDSDYVQRLFATLKKFVALFDELNDNYIVFFDEKGNVRILLVSTGSAVRAVSKRMGNGIFFSATLAPEEYYRHMLGAGKRDAYVDLESPFSRDNFKVISYAVSTRYSERESTLGEIINVIHSSVVRKKGNYMVFLPSYSYMMTVADAFAKRFADIEVAVEKQGMNASDKKSYLDRFSETRENVLVGFAVMGGSFSEGVDLVGDRLSGAIIVGLGVLPPERSRELTALYFNDRFFDGVKFAYMYPGMNKLFQAGGRVIRSESDRGFLVVIDDRFLTEDYREHLPDFWRNISKVNTFDGVGNVIEEFWKNN